MLSILWTEDIFILNGFTPSTNTCRISSFALKTVYHFKYYDAVTDTHYVYLTNNFKISASTVADLYRHRWQIELFFKWIKQHLKIQVFWGYSFNAVKTQICIAISTFLLVAIAKKQLNVKLDLYEILQILQVSQFEKTALHSLISDTELQIMESNRQIPLDLGKF